MSTFNVNEASDDTRRDAQLVCAGISLILNSLHRINGYETNQEWERCQAVSHLVEARYHIQEFIRLRNENLEKWYKEKEALKAPFLKG